MAINWYQCNRCDTLIKKDSTPSTSGCSKAGNHCHSWTKLGEIGDINYQCVKCGTTIQCRSTPSTSGCSSSNHCHSWQKL